MAVLPAPSPEDQRQVQAQIEFGRVKAVHDAAGMPLLAGLGFAVLVVALMRPFAPVGVLVGWLAWRAIFTVLRLVAIARFRRDALAFQRASHWRRVFIALLAPDAANWAAMPILFMPYVDANGDLMLFAAAVGVCAVGAFTTWHHRAAGIAFIALVILPISADQLLNYGRTGIYSGLALWIYVALLVNEVIRAQAQLTETMTLRFGLARLAEQQRQALATAEAASAAKTRFLAAVSHEIRTPLNGVVGMAELLRTTDAAPQRAQRLEVLHHSAQHLQSLVNDLVDLGRLDAGRLELRPEAISPAEIARHVIELMQAPALAKGLRLGLQLSPELPPAVLADPERVRQVLFNLVGNAVKFTHDGHVTLSADAWPDGLRFSITDTGDGIPADSIHRVFEAFEQAGPHAQARRAGAGLGLTISRQLARAMGGELRCRSVLGEGTTFEFELRAPRCDPPAEPIAPPAAPAVGKGRVLVVDDNAVNALVAEGMLQQLSLQADMATDGEQALRMLDQCDYAVVLMDCLMPGMDGLEATRRWRLQERMRQRPRLPIVALTANASRGDREACLEAGMDDYLAKPFSLEELARVLAGRMPSAPPVAPAPASRP